MTDVQDRAGLAAVRCLHASGHRVTGASITRLGSGLWSRGCSSRQLLPDPRESVEAFLARLEALLHGRPHQLLLPVRDETLYAVSLHRDRLEPHVATGLPPHAVVEVALDKRRMASEARSVGLVPPEQRVCESLEQALDAAQSFGFPVLVKGAQTMAEADSRSVRYKTELIHDPRALEKLLQRGFGTCIVERRSEGRLVHFAGVATDNGLLGSLFARCERTWPLEAGSGTYLETAPIADQLYERMEALIGAIGWRGIFQLEMIERPDGVLHPIDFNARPYGSIGLARPAGAPLVTLWCEWALGGSAARRTAGPGRRYRWEEGDAQHIARRARNGDLRGALRALMPGRGTAHAVFQVRDPLPFAALCLVLVRGLLRHWRRRLRRPARADVGS